MTPRCSHTRLTLGCLCIGILAFVPTASPQDTDALERQFRELPMESRRLTGPLFWLHGDESKDRLEMYVGKVAEGGNGCFTAESRPHNDWLGPGWYRDLAICLEAAKKQNLKMWIFDEKWWPSQQVAGMAPSQYTVKRLEAVSTDLEGPLPWEADGYGGLQYIAAVVGQMAADGKIEGESLVDLSPFVRDGKVSWQVPPGKWKVMKFTYAYTGHPGVDGASKDGVEWFLKTVYQPHYDRFGDDFGKSILGFFYDEPETLGDWGTELNRVLAEWNVDWKKAYVAYKFELAGEQQAAAKYQYLDAFAEAWGRTMYGGMAQWCRDRGVKSIGHFLEHDSLYHARHTCAGDMMRLQKYSDMGGVDAVIRQFVIGKRIADDHPTWQVPKLGSSISHVFGKPDDVTMCEIFGARGQDLTYSEMKWWTDHMQVSGVNFMIPHSFNPRAPSDTDCPPYFYNGGYEPRWPLYRVYADYTSRLSLMLTGGRHVCPVALLFMGQSAQVGRFVAPDDISTSLQDGLIDCDWMPYEVFEGGSRIAGKELQLYQERYRVLIVPSVEVIPYATMAKAKEFFAAGGVVVGYGFLPSKSATLGHDSQAIAAIRHAIWGDNPSPSLTPCQTNAAGGRSYFLPENPTSEQLQQILADAGIRPTLEVIAGETSGWLHVLHRVKAERDMFLVCNQNHEGAARQFKFRATAAGEPECWDAMRNEITTLSYQRVSDRVVEFSLSLEPLETVLLVFQPKRQDRAPRVEPGVTSIGTPLVLIREPNQTTVAQPEPSKQSGQFTASPVAAADPFRTSCIIPAGVDLAHTRVYLEMEDLPDNAASVTVNGVYAGGLIGRPLRLDITQCLRSGENRIVIEPLAPKTARIVTIGADHGSLTAVPFTAVEFHDAFWAPRLKTNRENTIPHLFQCCEQTGRISNFAKAAKLIEGRHEGTCANDSDVFKLLEGASYSLATHPDTALEKTVDAVIAQIAAAQQPDGYLNTYFTLAEPGQRWTDLKDKHELYCAGHLFEAAVAHWRATGKRTLLDVAIKYADCIDNTFGSANRHGLCGHEEIELALVKLHQATAQKKYLDLAAFFLDMRGNKAARGGETWGAYYQDHLPIAEQNEIVGHAVRAMYLYSGTADVAACTGNPQWINAMTQLWRDVVQRKMYLTGGIGARHAGEAFGEPYELPNDSAYCETCAAIGLALWAHRMNLLHSDAQYVDVLERAIYNGILSGVSLDGKRFFYTNPLASDGSRHRQPFLDPACCPSNLVRFIPSLPGYQYAVGNDGIFVNLYVAGSATIARGDKQVTLTQETEYPWDGEIKLTIQTQKTEEFSLRLRIPEWCDGAEMAVNGTPVQSLTVEKGYACLRRGWKSGDVIRLTMPMPIRCIEANPEVKADAGRVAIQRGPLVYCLEAVDNGGPVSDIVLPSDPKLTAEHHGDLLGGCTAVSGSAQDGRAIKAIPYYAWDHREPGEMAVWIRRDGKADKPDGSDPAWKDNLYRPY